MVVWVQLSRHYVLAPWQGWDWCGWCWLVKIAFGYVFVVDSPCKSAWGVVMNFHVSTVLFLLCCVWACEPLMGLYFSQFKLYNELSIHIEDPFGIGHSVPRLPADNWNLGCCIPTWVLSQLYQDVFAAHSSQLTPFPRFRKTVLCDGSLAHGSTLLGLCVLWEGCWT